MKIQNRIPAMPIHPGEVLADELKMRGLKQSAFAETSGISRSLLNEVIKGKRGIHADMALTLETALGIDAEIWINLQKYFELDTARIKRREKTQAGKNEAA